ncbi:MAG: PAS domain S-box protein [Lentisphaerae bacterium]|nr:PAS domain S-box protein [Lentisphaerota bacterium]
MNKSDPREGSVGRATTETDIRQLAQVVDQSPVVVVITDRDGCITYVNSAFEKTTGYSAAEVMGRNPRILKSGRMPDAEYAELWKTLSSGGVWQGEFLNRRKDGTLYWEAATLSPFRDPDGNITHYLGLKEVISSRKRTEAELRESRSRFESLVESMPQNVFSKDLEGRFTFANQRYCRTEGKPLEEILGKTDFDLHPQELARQYLEDDLQVIRSGKIVERIEMHQPLGGPRSFVQVVKAPIYDADGRAKGMLGIFWDVTERKRAEEEKEKLRLQLVQSQKMESVGRLAGGVAHDFNNMLGAILGYADLVIDKLEADSPLRGDLEEIRRAAQRSAALTRQLLAFARRQTVAPRVIDLNETVTGLLQMIRRVIGEDIDLTWRPGSGLWPVKLDPAQIDQILVNLCVNARDAMPSGGRIVIETANVELTAENAGGEADFVPGDYVRVTVTDTGCGMDAETLSHLFEPFFTTKGMGKGTGLGLATVYGAVTQNNGRVHVDSTPGKGTTFRIDLPRHAGEAEMKTEARGPSVPSLTGGETILLVEDDPAMLGMSRAVLQRLGYVVVAAASPEEALRLVRSHHGRLDLLMTDVVMPGMNGRELALSLMAIRPDLRLLFMSGYTADVIAHQGMLDEGVHFIQKPFTKRDLAAKLREVLEA